MNLPNEYTLLCVDPSLKQTGFSIIKVSDKLPHNWNDKNLKLIDYGIIPTHGLDHGQALMYFEKVVMENMKKHKPNYVVAEAPFAGKNRDTIQKLAHIHGILQLACAKNNLNISYYSVMTAKSQTLNGIKAKHEDGTKKTGDEMKQEVADRILEIFKKESFTKEYNLDITDSISLAIPFIVMDGEAPKKPKKKKKKV